MIECARNVKKINQKLTKKLYKYIRNKIKYLHRGETQRSRKQMHILLIII